MAVKSVSTSSVQIVNHNPRRSSLTLSNNDSAAIIYIDTHSPVTTASGMDLQPYTKVVYNRVNGDDPSLARYAISDTADKELRVEESFA